MVRIPKQDTSAGERSSGEHHTRDYDDSYGAGDARYRAKRNDDHEYHDGQPRAGGRTRTRVARPA